MARKTKLTFAVVAVIIGCCCLAVVATLPSSSPTEVCEAFVRGEAQEFQRLAPVGDSVDYWYMNGAEGIVNECLRLQADWRAGNRAEHQSIYESAMAGHARGSIPMSSEESGMFTFHSLLRTLAHFPGTEETFYTSLVVAVHDFFHGRVQMAQIMGLLL